MILPDLCGTKLLLRRKKKKKIKNPERQTGLLAARVSFNISMRRLRGEISGFFASLNEMGQDFFHMGVSWEGVLGHTQTRACISVVSQGKGAVSSVSFSLLSNR